MIRLHTKYMKREHEWNLLGMMGRALTLLNLIDDDIMWAWFEDKGDYIIEVFRD